MQRNGSAQNVQIAEKQPQVWAGLRLLLAWCRILLVFYHQEMSLRQGMGSSCAGPCGSRLSFSALQKSPLALGSFFGASLFIYKGGAKIAQVWRKSLKNWIFSLFQAPFSAI